MPDPMEDFFLPLDFTMFKEGHEPENLVHFLDEGRLWDLDEQPEHIGSPRHTSVLPGSKECTPRMAGVKLSLNDGAPPQL